MPRLFDDNAPAPIERRVPRPVTRVPGPHTYRLRFDNREDEVIVAETAAEAVALREGGVNARLPFQITDETEADAWLTRLQATHFGA